MIGLVYRIPESRVELVIELVQRRDGAEIAIGAAGVAHIAQADRQSKVGVYFPRIPNVPRKAVVGTQSSTRESEG